MHTTILIALALLAFLIVKGGSEGWRPYAWYGYPGTKPGTVGYQARGDWCGIVPATIKVDKPLPLIAPAVCNRRRGKN